MLRRPVVIGVIVITCLCVFTLTCNLFGWGEESEDASKANNRTSDDDVIVGGEDPLESMILIGEGSFPMGCNDKVSQCKENELPRHDVFLSAYYIDVYEVTNQQYADYLNQYNPENICDDVYNTASCIVPMENETRGIYKDNGVWVVHEGYENRPVNKVSWFGAKYYCEIFDKRLPTEAEWEKAARYSQYTEDTTDYSYPWGDSWDPNAANWFRNGDPYEDDPYPQTTPVGYFDGSLKDGYQTSDGTNEAGLYDMAGNVKEWVHDLYNPRYYSMTPEGGWINPQGPRTNQAWSDLDMRPCHVLRGGDFFRNDISRLRTTQRTTSPDSHPFSAGFRCVMDVE